MATEITVDDILNKTFNRFPETTRQKYVDLANAELIDMAKVITGDVVIADPLHNKLKEYAVNYAVMRLASDNALFNNNDGMSGTNDIYTELFKQQEYILQGIKNQIVPVMFTGDTETPYNRALRSQRLYRG